MAGHVELGDETTIPILYEDRSVMALDKPPGWMLVPYNWQETNRNLHLALDSAIRQGKHWARSRNLKFLRHIHRLDAETTGILLFAKSPGALETFSRLFESRAVEKRYLAVVNGVPAAPRWDCVLRIAPDPRQVGRMRVDARSGKEALTSFQLLSSRDGLSLIEARPVTGRTHQIRVHLSASGLPVVGDPLYGRKGTPGSHTPGLALRAVALRYRDPFRHRPVSIRAPDGEFLEQYGFRDPGSAWESAPNPSTRLRSQPRRGARG